MKLLYIGAGYVGACSAAVNTDSGHDALVYDIDKEKIKKLFSLSKDIIESCLFEEGLGELIIRNKDRLNFTCNLDRVKKFINQTEAVFMCLPTPEKGKSGETDLTYYEEAVKILAKILTKRNNNTQSQYILIINKSTVPIDTAGKTKEILDSFGVVNYGVGSNPEFLVEGKAIEGSIRPQRVVVGAWRQKDFLIFRDIYKRFYESPKTAYIEVNPIEAEAGKLLANFILFNRLIICFDVVGRVCERFNNLHYESVRKIIIADKRIGSWGFYNSLFAGGSCLIKDTKSLTYQLAKKEAAVNLLINTLEANFQQIDNFLARPESELQFDWSGKKIGLLGMAFKRDTNDIRNSAALNITDFLLEKKVKYIKAYDPVAIDNFKNYYDNQKKIILAKDETEAIFKADVLIIATDWPQFRELTEKIKANLNKGGLIMDGRRMLQHKYNELSQAGYNIIAVGSPLIKRIYKSNK
ncbi:UDP-glucose/GDP-mannose dehydrogenase family protein [Candidatus Parcubacteria bacterium]|nr:UDP-glucose/GDP-mannose dehydrogenase family protein [Candidatus Parcubacteria bacterium]